MEPIISGCFPIDRNNYKDKFTVKLYNTGLLYYPGVSYNSNKNGLTARLSRISKVPLRSRKSKSSSSSSPVTPCDSLAISQSTTCTNDTTAQAAAHADNEHKRKEHHRRKQNQDLQYEAACSSIALGNSLGKLEVEPTTKNGKESVSNSESTKQKTSVKPQRPTDLAVNNHISNQNNAVLNGASSSRGHSRSNSNVSNNDVFTHVTPGSPIDGKEFSPQYRYLPLLSILGCDCQRGESSEDVATYFVVYAYPRSRLSKDPKSPELENLSPGEKGRLPAIRRQEILTMKFVGLPTFEENYKEAARWMVALRTLLRGYNNVEETITDGDVLRMPAAQRLLIMVNPFSGPGQALTIFQERVVPLLAQAQIDYKLVVTERAGHAEEFVKDMELTQWNGIVIVSGDGLLFEVVNGLMKRSDWKSAIKIPLGVIPGGSGNALACSICNYAGEPYMDKHVLHSSFIIAKQRDVIPMDLVAIDTCVGKRLYSFLSFGWGMMSDVDISSERYRSLGNSRFALVAVFKIFGMKKYRGRVSFLPVDDYEIPTHSKAGTFHIQKGSGGSRNKAASSPVGAPLTPVGDELSPYLPPLDQPVPEGWIVNEDDFILMAGVYQSHLAKDNLMTPQATLDDGVIHLVFVRGVCTRLQMLNLFIALENGINPAEHAGYAEVIKVKAFRLEPLTPRGMMTVDGEMIDYGPIQAQVLPKLARVMSLKKTSANEFD